MFSPYVQKTDKNLEEQIDLLLKVYSNPTDVCKRDGSIVHGEYSNKYGKQSSLADSVFPVVSNNTYYWCWVQLMYENDFDEEQIGITKFILFSADYYCAIRYEDEDIELSDTPSLSVLTEYTMDCEVRAIDGNPYKYTPIERTITKAQITDFFKISNCYSEFIEQFGKPNAINIYIIYELSSDNEPYYLRLGVDKQTDSIYSASIVDNFGYMDTLWKEED